MNTFHWIDNSSIKRCSLLVMKLYFWVIFCQFSTTFHGGLSKYDAFLSKCTPPNTIWETHKLTYTYSNLIYENWKKDGLAFFAMNCQFSQMRILLYGTFYAIKPGFNLLRTFVRPRTIFCVSLIFGLGLRAWDQSPIEEKTGVWRFKSAP